GDKAGSTTFDGAEDKTWNTLKFVPPAPKIEAPKEVQVLFLDGAYALTDAEGRVLFTGDCRTSCAAWTPLAAGRATGTVGQWAANRNGDLPQGPDRGKAIFVSQEDDPKTPPPSGKVLRP